jgi:hypothetical protein
MFSLYLSWFIDFDLTLIKLPLDQLWTLQTIDDLIETGKSEQIFKDAIQQQGRGQVCVHFIDLGYLSLAASLTLSLYCIKT